MGITSTKTTTNIEDAIREETKTTAFAYTNKGLIPTSLDNPQCIIKSIYTKNQHIDSTKYYLLTGPDGSLYNPFGSYNETNMLRRNKRTGKPYWKFKETSQLAYNTYMRFLETQNNAHYLLADRETRNNQ